MHLIPKADNPPKDPEDDIAEVASIKGKLILKGLSLSDVDRLYSLPRGTAGTALREPNIKGERAIAAALGTKPHLLWRRRYHASGLRKSPQPPENYERLLQRRRGQKEARA